MPNTAKQEAIRNAYGEYWGRFPKNIKEEIFLLDGWLDWLSLNDISLGLLWLEIRNSLDVNIDSDKDRLRPKPLQGIENNNGWTIANVSDLPIEGIFNVGKFLNDGSFHQGNDDVEWYDLREYIIDFGFTHYQPIVKPESLYTRQVL